jgi:hypothetical protein
MIKEEKMMLDKKLSSSFSEVDDIIKHMDRKMQEKIPNTFKKFIKENCDLSYDVNIDYSRNLNDQIQKNTKVIISIIYRDYLVEGERKRQLQELDSKAIEEKYNIDNIFNKKNKVNTNSELEKDNNENNVTLVEANVQSNFIKKFINKIKKWLHFDSLRG